MKIFAITLGDERAASSDFRIFRYRPLMKANNIEFSWVSREKLSLAHLFAMARSDVVINQKCILPLGWGLLIRAVSKRLLFEWDDAFWTRPGKPYNFFVQLRINSRLRWWLKHADAASCANNFIAAYARKFNKNTVVIPMALDLARWRRINPRPNSGDFVLGWSGAPANLPYLKICEKPIGEFLKKHPEAKLKILCGKKPDLAIPFEHEPWMPGSETAFLEGIDVGLLPLAEDDAFTLGKSPIKSLQYMAYGIPVVGNMNAGGAAEIAQGGGCISVKNGNEWLAAFETLKDPDAYARHSSAALQNMKQNHEMISVFQKMVKIWKAAG